MKLCQILWYPIMCVERAWVFLTNWKTYSDDEGKLPFWLCKSLNDSISISKYNYFYTYKKNHNNNLKNQENWDFEKDLIKVPNYGCKK